MSVLGRYPVLIGHSVRGKQTLHDIKQVAEYICEEGIYGDILISDKDGTPFLDTYGIYVNKIVDMEYLEELLKVLIPMQELIDGSNIQ